MRTQMDMQVDEGPAFDELTDEHVWTIDLVDHRRRGRGDDEGLGLRALADCPEWLSRSYWRRLRAA